MEWRGINGERGQGRGRIWLREDLFLLCFWVMGPRRLRLRKWDFFFVNLNKNDNTSYYVCGHILFHLPQSVSRKRFTR